MKKNDLLFICSNGRVAAIRKIDGEIAWEISLKAYAGRSLNHYLGQILQEGDKLFIGCSGMMFCLSVKDGSLLWKNGLKGWGYEFVSIANQNSEAAAAAQIAAMQAATGVTTAAT